MTNVAIPASGTGDAGKIVATETIGGVEYQLVKLITGTPGSTTPITTLPVSNASLPLPTGASTEATLSAQSAKLPAALGQTTMAGSLSVAIASNQSAVPVSGTVTADTELNAAAALADAAAANVSTASVGAVPLLMNATTLDRARAVVNAMDSTGTGIAAAGIVAQLDDASPGTVTENQFSTVRMSSRRALLIEGDGPTTATTAGTQVASSATSVTLLSSNANRRGFLFYNGSTSVAYVLFGTTASATSFSVYMAPGSTYEMVGVNVYSGRIDAIWVTANGNMQVTEW